MALPSSIAPGPACSLSTGGPSCERRGFASPWAVLLLTLFLVACGGGSAVPPGTAKNLLLVSIDTLRADALGCYGGTRGASPELDQLARRSVRFEQAWSHSPKTAPSHMSLLTGLPPRVHGVGNLRTAGGQRLGERAETLAETLRRRGFRTAGFTSGGNVKGLLGFDRGFEVYEDRGMRMEQKLPAVRQWLKERGDERWFLFFHTYQVHDPYFVSRELLQRFTDPNYAGRILGVREELIEAMKTEDLAPDLSGDERVTANFWYRVQAGDAADERYLHDLYTAGVADMDRTLGRFVSWLEGQGLLDETLLVVTSDHGEEFGEHGKTKHDQLWRELLHVPLLVRLPGDRAAGRVVTAPVRHIDFVPSVLELLGVADDAALRLGESWAPWLDAPESERPGRQLFAEHRAKRDHDLDVWTLRQDGWLLYRHAADEDGRPRDELFELSTDPDELEPRDDAARRAALTEFAQRRIGSLQRAAAEVGGGAGIELDPDTRAELEALGYLGGETETSEPPRGDGR